MGSKLTYRADIDGLRAIAVLAVIFFHADFAGFSGGFVGVDVFFVLSGYLITQRLFRELEETNKVSLLRFYAHRARRILPALLVLITGVLGLWCVAFLGNTAVTSNLAKSAAASSVGLANYYFMTRVGGYFDLPSLQMPLLHLWSLGVEEQFYAVFPLLFLALSFVTRARRKTVLIGLLAFIVLVSLGYAHTRITSSDFATAFYSPFSRAWELGFGALLAVGEPAFISIGFLAAKKRRSIFSATLAVIGLFALVFSIGAFNSKTPFPGLWALIPVLGTVALILSATLSPTAVTTRLFSLRPLVHLGLLSYGWYLWHWPFFVLQRIALMGEEPSMSARLVAIIASYLCALCSFHLIEKPIRLRVFGSRLSNGATLAAALIIVGCVFVSTFVLRPLEENKLDSAKKFIEKIAARSSLDSTCNGVASAILNGQCSKSYGVQPKKRIFVWGNSHALALFPMIEEFGLDHSFSTTLGSHGGIPGLNYTPDLFVGSDSEIANDKVFHEVVYKRLKAEAAETAPGDFSVILASRWMQFSCRPQLAVRYAETRCLDRNQNPDATLAITKASLQKTLTELSAIGVSKILILLPYPEFRYEVSNCWWSKTACRTSRAAMDEYRKPMVEMIRSLALNRADIKIVDPVEALCDSTVCPQFTGSTPEDYTPLVFDDSHPSVDAAKLLTSKFKSELEWLL